MPTKFREMDRILRKDGWKLDRVTGSHYIYTHPTKPGTVTVPFHGSNSDLSPITLKSIMKQAGLL